MTMNGGSPYGFGFTITLTASDGPTPNAAMLNDALRLTALRHGIYIPPKPPRDHVPDDEVPE